MKLSALSTLLSLVILTANAQQDQRQKIIDLAKTYKNFMFRNEATKDVIKETKSNVPNNLKSAADFIAQCVTSKNDLLTKAYLSRPADDVLKEIYIIRSVNLNLREENPIDNDKLIDSLSNKRIPTYELVDNYYAMLFAGVGNKNQPFDFSRMDFKQKEYGFKDDTEKGIMFLQCMDLCGTNIWGYMNIPKPANTAKAYATIKKFPKFNGQPYYQYTDFYFKDFEMKIVKNQGVQSYKSYYINKFYETLLYHNLCLKKEGASEKEQNDLLLGSILKEENLYKFTKYKENLEKLFKKSSLDFSKEQKEIVSEGKKLYRIDMASWYGTDIFLEKFGDTKKNRGGYFSYLEDKTAVCVFYSNDIESKIIATFKFDSTYNVNTAVVDNQDRAPTEKESAMLTIRKAALAEFQADSLFKRYKDMNPNLIPVIDELGKRVYILTGPEKEGVVVFGNDYVLNYGADNRLISKKPIHKNLIPVAYSNTTGQVLVASMHTHLPSTGDYITATDVCTLMLYEKFAKWKQHIVMSENNVSIWNCEKDELMIMTRSAWDAINGDQQKRK